MRIFFILLIGFAAALVPPLPIHHTYPTLTHTISNPCVLLNNLSQVSKSCRPFLIAPPHQQSRKSTKHSIPVTKLHATDLGDEDIEDTGDEVVIRRPKLDALVEAVSLRIRRVSWLSWWSQVILTTIASVTLLFTRNVLNLQTNKASVDRNLLPNYFLAGSSITFGFISIFWTWATRRLSRRLLRKPTTRIQAANMLRKDTYIGGLLNLLGMAFALIGAEQIVGGLAIKVLTTATSTPAVYQGAQSVSLLQPLDILVVQANTNILFSHFCSLVANLWLSRSVDRLDPPSKENSKRS
jgi:hypothetical protein